MRAPAVQPAATPQGPHQTSACGAGCCSLLPVSGGSAPLSSRLAASRWNSCPRSAALLLLRYRGLRSAGKAGRAVTVGTYVRTDLLKLGRRWLLALSNYQRKERSFGPSGQSGTLSPQQPDQPPHLRRARGCRAAGTCGRRNPRPPQTHRPPAGKAGSSSLCLCYAGMFTHALSMPRRPAASRTGCASTCSQTCMRIRPLPTVLTTAHTSLLKPPPAARPTPASQPTPQLSQPTPPASPGSRASCGAPRRCAGAPSAAPHTPHSAAAAAPRSAAAPPPPPRQLRPLLAAVRRRLRRLLRRRAAAARLAGPHGSGSSRC